MPVTRWDLHKAVRSGAQVADESLLVAEIGSLTLEFTRLFQLTDNPKWYDAVDRITEIFDKQQRMTRLSGTWPIFVSVREADLTQNGAFTLGATDDSVYKYLLKMHALPGRSAIYEKLYRDSMSAPIHRTFFRPMTPDDADIFLAGNIHVDNANQTTLPLNSEDQHLVCFAGGMFAIGSRLPDHPDHLDIARKLTQRCIWTYRALPSGIMLEVFNLVPCVPGSPYLWNEAQWHAEIVKHAGVDISEVENAIGEQMFQKGVAAIRERRCILRAEAIESVFILYRITGERAFLDHA
ncbi:hypothetical protein B0A49_00419 [Cryomyces minteri]|uniref:alpha-1,2-Mannosidase n=1 Tax=Cryomyces minteri TaxID=331657 RepID=A0A4U0XWJ9_9PEZI|nr:hypothetical protein B0A49_00419 [Cryomyces minteri]